MTEVQTGEGRSAIARNLAGFRQRLRRVRVPDAATPAYPRGRLVLAAAALAAALIVLFMLTLDNHSVAWWQGLSKSERRAFDAVTRFGKSDWLLIPTGVFCIALLFADWSRTGRRVAAAWIEVGNLTAFFFFSIAFAGIITNLIKWTVGRSRPILFAEDGVFTLSFLSFDYAHVSFPSGHATTVSAALVAIALIFRGRWVLITIVGIACGGDRGEPGRSPRPFPERRGGRHLRRRRLHLPLRPCPRAARGRLPAPARRLAPAEDDRGAAGAREAGRSRNDDPGPPRRLVRQAGRGRGCGKAMSGI